MLVLLSLSLALAADPSTEPEGPGALRERSAPDGVRIVPRLVVEMWNDPYLASRFRSGGPGAALGAVIPVVGPFAVDVELGYQRIKGENDGILQMMPLSVLAEARWVPDSGHGLELFTGVGPTLTSWSESAQDPAWMGELQDDPDRPPPTVLRGARPGVELRVGSRIDLGWVQPSLAPAPSSAVTSYELEIHLARRFAPTSSGFDLNTWRAGLGLALVF